MDTDPTRGPWLTAARVAAADPGTDSRPQVVARTAALPRTRMRTRSGRGLGFRLRLGHGHGRGRRPERGPWLIAEMPLPLPRTRRETGLVLGLAPLWTRCRTLSTARAGPRTRARSLALTLVHALSSGFGHIVGPEERDSKLGSERGRSGCVPPPLPRTRARTRIPSPDRGLGLGLGLRLRNGLRLRPGFRPGPRPKCRRIPTPDRSSARGADSDAGLQLTPPSLPDGPRPQPRNHGSLGLQPAPCRQDPRHGLGPRPPALDRGSARTRPRSPSSKRPAARTRLFSDSRRASYLVSRLCPDCGLGLRL